MELDMTDWGQIVREHGPLVWRTVYRLLAHDADAADCFQNTFVAAWQYAAKHSVRHWPALLQRLATARALDRLRQRYHVSAKLTQTLDNLPPDGRAAEPAVRMEQEELASQLREALARLDARQAEAFCLAAVEEMSYRDIAEQLDITVKHAGVLLNRARSGLREHLAEYDPSPSERASKPEVER